MGTLTYRLTVIEPAAGTPFTPGQVGDPDDHFYVTSRRRTAHPWIASPPEGEGASVDPVTGRTTDGQYSLRVIDVPSPACSTYTTSTVADKNALGFTNAWSANGWVAYDDAGNIYPHPRSWCTNDVSNFVLSGSALFNWNDDGAGHGLGPVTRSVWIEKTLTGLTPGTLYGLTFSLSWTLDTGGGNIFLEIEGASGASRYSVAATGGTIWTVTTLVNDALQRLRATADGAGEITVRVGGEYYSPSCNVQCVFSDLTLEEMTCVSDPSGIAAGARYVTTWLADDAARQRLLGREAVLEESLDNGGSWSAMFRGYVTGLRLPRSLVYEFEIGDSRRVERTRQAWRGLSPAAEPAFSQMTALVGGPIFGGLEPMSPRFSPPRFRIISQQVASGTTGPNEAPDGWVRLNYISGPLPPIFAHPGTDGALDAVYDGLNSRAQRFWNPDATVDATLPSGAFPTLRATLLTPPPVPTVDWVVELDDLVPLGQSFTRRTVKGNWLTRGINLVRGRYNIERGQEFISQGLEIVLRWGVTSALTYPNGTYLHLLITPREVSEEFPLYWRGHPVDLEEQLLTRHGIDVDATTQATVRAALGPDLGVVLRFTDPAQTVQDVLDELHAHFGFATRLAGDGTRAFFLFRDPVDATPALALTDDDLRAEGGPTYALDEGSRVNRVVLSQQYFRSVVVQGQAPDADDSFDLLAVQDVDATFDYSTDGGTTLDADTVGPLEQAFTLPGHVAWRDSLVDGSYSSTVPMNLQQWGTGLARRLFTQFGRGGQEATIVTRRGTDADSAIIGTDVELTAAHVPNAQLGQSPVSQRGGTRWWRVIRRDEAPEGPVLTLLDAGTGIAYGELVTPALYRDTLDPARYYRVELANSTALVADGAWVEIEVRFGSAPTPSDAGVLATVVDGNQMVDNASAAVDPWPVRLGPLPETLVVWVRSRAFLVGGTPGTWSCWTGLGGDLCGAGALSNLRIVSTTDTTASIAWDNADATNQVKVQTRVNNTGAWVDFATLAIGSTSSTITGLTAGTLYGVRVVLWDGAAEVGSGIAGTFTTGAGALSGLTIGTPATNYVVLSWSNSHATYDVKVEYQVDGDPQYSLFRVFPAQSVNCRLTGLQPSTDYNVRVVLVNASGSEYGTALTGSFTTAAASGTLAAPTNPAAFAGYDPASGGLARGIYGLRVWADTSNPPHEIVIEEAVETAVGSATPGAYSEADFLPAQFSGATIWSSTTANDGKLRYLRAFARLAGYNDSAATAAVSIDPWAIQPPTDVPLVGTVAFAETALAEDASDVGEFLIAPGAEVVRVEITNSKASRVQLYETAAARTADAARAPSVLPQPGTGVLYDCVFVSPDYANDLNPTFRIIDRSGDYNPTITVYYRITSYVAGTNDVDALLTYALATSATGMLAP